MCFFEKNKKVIILRTIYQEKRDKVYNKVITGIKKEFS